MTNLRNELIEAHRGGTLLKAIENNLSPDDAKRRTLVQELADLHNEGSINIVAEFGTLKNSPPNPGFFMTRGIFEKALTLINAPVDATMKTVIQLWREAGQDMAAGTVLNGYIEFCLADPSRPLEALKEIEAAPDELACLLPATIVAGSRQDNPYFVAAAVRLCQAENLELRRQAVFSIGRIQRRDGPPVSESALGALEQSVANETDGPILANAIKSAFAVIARDKSQENRGIALIDRALSNNDDYALHGASEVFGFSTDEIPVSLIDILLSRLARVKPASKGTLENIDCGLASLLKKDAHKALSFLEEVLIVNEDELTIEAFDDAARQILQQKPLLSKVVTRWFLKPPLARSVQIILDKHHGDDPLLEIDPDELKPSEALHSIFVARKAIGYLFLRRPLTATNILISLMRNTSDDGVLRELAELLFDPMLLNFPGKVRDCVEARAVSESERVKDLLVESLKRIDDYLETVRSVETLPALHPSQSQRETYHRHYSRMMADSFKAAQAQSVFLNLIAKKVLLYGTKSIGYVYTEKGQSQRMEMPLKSHSFQMEFPRMEIIDSYGLDYMLRVFRAEEMRS
jgi:hypothetical protein